jgi:hypothetical protein
MTCIETIYFPLKASIRYITTPRSRTPASFAPAFPHALPDTTQAQNHTSPSHTHQNTQTSPHKQRHPVPLPRTQTPRDACQEICIWPAFSVQKSLPHSCIWPAIPARKHPPSPSERDRREKEGKVGGSRDGGSKRGRYLIIVDSTEKHRIYAFRFNGKVVAVQKPILFPKRAGVSQKIGLCASCVRHHKALRLHAMRESYPLFGAHTQQRRVN